MSTGQPLTQNIHHLRRLVPVSLVPKVVERRLDRLWQDTTFRVAQEAQMEFLLGRTSRADEVPQLAHSYAHQMMIRSFLRWHPGAITQQRVEGVDWLTSRRDPDRGVILSFMHHHRYDGMFGSLVNAGVPPLTMVITEAIARPEAGIAFAQHLRVASRGGDFVNAEDGTEELASRLRAGATLAVAPDFPGRTPVTFLGRRVLGSFGNARLAMLTNSPVVLVTHRRDEMGPFVRLEEPIEPGDFSDAADLLEQILSRHGEAVLDWPEAFESPGARFGRLEDE